MALSRYTNRNLIKNISRRYAESDIFRERQLHSPTQFTVAQFKQLSADEIEDLQIETKVWTVGEKYFKLAHEFYGDPEYWWVIAWFNERPLESQFTPGDIVEIPLPLELMLEYLDIL
jgi:hypothetical protein